MIAKVRTFFGEVATELRKVSWLTRQELIDSTWIVLISSFFLGIFIMCTDLIVSRLLSLIVR